MENRIEEYIDINRAYYSSYRIVTKKITFEDLLDEDSDKGYSTLLIHDPEREVTPDLINDLIDYFVELEEYELCAELKDILDKKIIS
jgi:hypothetical protein